MVCNQGGIQMKNIMTRTLAVICTATTMMIGIGGFNANAATYNLHYTEGAPSSAIVTTQKVGVWSAASRTKMTESCTNYTCPTHSDGSKTYASYTSYYVTSDGTVSGSLHSTQYHYEKQASHTVSFNRTVPEQATVYTTYKLNNYGGYTSQIAGSVN